MSKLTAQYLAQFTGTTRYYRISKQHLLTDGTHFLAEQAGCYWIMDAIASHVTEIGTEDWFIVVRIEVTDHQAVIRYENGNGRKLARQAIPYTDLPLSELTLYAVWDTEHWVTCYLFCCRYGRVQHHLIRRFAFSSVGVSTNLPTAAPRELSVYLDQTPQCY